MIRQNGLKLILRVIGVATSTMICALPDFSDSKYSEILRAFKEKHYNGDTKSFNKAFIKASTRREFKVGSELGGQHDSRKAVFLAPSLHHALGALFNSIHTQCGKAEQYNDCVQETLGGEFGEFLMFALHPDWTDKKASRFEELYDKYADQVGIFYNPNKPHMERMPAPQQKPMPAHHSQDNPQPVQTPSSAVASPVPTKQKTDFSKLELNASNITDQRVLDFVKLAAHKAGYEVEDIEQVKARKNAMLADVKKDAALMLRRYSSKCPNMFTRMLTAQEVCDACDLLHKLQENAEEILDTAIEDASLHLRSQPRIDGTSHLSKDDVVFEKAKLLRTGALSPSEHYQKTAWLGDSALLRGAKHFAYAFDMPLEAMMNPATLKRMFEQ